jgi:hypothetical protein
MWLEELFLCQSREVTKLLVHDGTTTAEGLLSLRQSLQVVSPKSCSQIERVVPFDRQARVTKLWASRWQSYTTVEVAQ